MTPSPNRPWMICAAFGVAVLLCAGVIFAIFPTTGGDFSDGYGAPVYAFEMARSPGDLTRVFGEATDAQRSGRITAMDRGNRWDFLFLVLYGGFIASFFVAASRESQRKPWLAFAVVGVVAATADAIENVILLGLTADLAKAPYIGLLRYPVWTKFMCILLASLGAAAYIAARGSRVWQILGAVAGLAALVGLAAVYSPPDYVWLLGGIISVAWATQLAYAVSRASRRPAPAQAS